MKIGQHSHLLMHHFVRNKEVQLIDEIWQVRLSFRKLSPRPLHCLAVGQKSQNSTTCQKP